MLKHILIISLLISFTISWNMNACAWGKVGNLQPNGANDCLGDQTSLIQDCCYMKLRVMGQQIFKLCYALPKYIVNAGTDEELTKGLQNDIGSLFTILELSCKPESPIEPDPKNVATANSCAYDTIKYDTPKEINDCVSDKDPANSSKCCYVETSWNGQKVKSCNTFSKIRDLEFDTWQGVYKQMGGELEKMECRAVDQTPVPLNLKKSNQNYLTYSFHILIVIILILF